MKLLPLLLLAVASAFGQTDKAIKLKVESTEIKVAAQEGGMTDWKKMEGLAQATEDHTITINFTKKIISDDYKLTGDTRKFYTYKIINYSHDWSMEDFGIYTTIMEVDEGEGKIKRYKLAALGCEKMFVLIVYSKTVQTRYILEAL